MTPEETFLAHLPFIERVATGFCRRRRLGREDTEDSVSLVKLHFIADEYRVLREFKNGSSLRTYMTTVIHNLGRDYLDKLWGKWRPSKEAKRLGPVAELTERLAVREGHGFDEACEILRRNHKVEMSDPELAALFAKLRLPRRAGRHREGEEALANVAAAERSDARAEEADRGRRRGEVGEILERAFHSLASEDQLLLRMLARDISVARIARDLGLKQKRVYPRKDRLLRSLREKLEAEGVTAEEIDEILGSGMLPEFLDEPSPEAPEYGT